MKNVYYNFFWKIFTVKYSVFFFVFIQVYIWWYMNRHWMAIRKKIFTSTNTHDTELFVILIIRWLLFDIHVCIYILISIKVVIFHPIHKISVHKSLQNIQCTDIYNIKNLTFILTEFIGAIQCTVFYHVHKKYSTTPQTFPVCVSDTQGYL